MTHGENRLIGFWRKCTARESDPLALGEPDCIMPVCRALIRGACREKWFGMIGP